MRRLTLALLLVCGLARTVAAQDPRTMFPCPVPYTGNLCVGAAGVDTILLAGGLPKLLVERTNGVTFLPTVRPAGPVEGTAYQDSTDHMFYIYSGSAWVAAGGGIVTVSEADLAFTDITTANATASLHGLLPKLSGNAYDWFTGAGTFSQTMARGTITTASPWTLSQTWNAAGVVFSGLDIAITRTASATLSSPLSVTIAGVGAAFTLVQDPNGFGASGANNKYAIGVNTGLSGVSQSFSLRSGANAVGIAAGDTSASLRPVWGRSFVSDTNFDAGVGQLFVGRDYGVKSINTLPYGWVADASDGSGSMDAAIMRDAAGVVGVTNGTAATYRDVRVRHYLGGGTAPAVSNTSANSCGTSAASLVGSDTAGKVTVGATSGTSCTVTFTAAFTNAPACWANNETTAALARATSTTTTVILAGAFTAADVISYSCLSY